MQSPEANLQPGITVIDCLLARVLVKCLFDEDYTEDLELARRLARFGEETPAIRLHLIGHGGTQKKILTAWNLSTNLTSIIHEEMNR